MGRINIRGILSHLILGIAMVQPINGSKLTLFDFTKLPSVNDWIEISDTVRTVGKSKASLVLQKTQEFQRAVFFTLLNPQPNGAGFAGVHVPVKLDLSGYSNLEILCRAQGSNNMYKIVLKHNGLQSYDDITYEQMFSTTISNENFENIKLPLSDFKAYYRGREIKDAEALNTANITHLGLQVFGGVYLPIKQSGVSSLEIDHICATK